MKIQKDVQSRKWLITTNNPNCAIDCETDQDYKEALTEWVEERRALFKSRSYVVAQFEKESTLHIQSYWQFSSSVRWSTVQTNFTGSDIRLVGTDNGAQAYCQKDKGRVGPNCTFGEPLDKRVNKSLREQLAMDVEQALDFYTTPSQLLYWKRIKTDPFFSQVKLSNLDDIGGVWIYGAPGFGKSHLARTRYGGESFYPKFCNKWWCGYNDQEVVIIDDVDPSHCTFLGYHFKIWLDKYPFVAEIKGGHLYIRPRLVVITSNHRIDQCFTDPVVIEAITRRCHIIHLAVKNY